MKRVPKSGVQGQSTRRRAPSPLLWLLIALSVITLGIAAWQWQLSRASDVALSSPRPPSKAQMAPPFQLETADGRTASLADERGRMVLLNFWATWCPPCRAEMPDLESLYLELGAELEFVVLGVNIQEAPETVLDFARTAGVTFPLLLDVSGDVARDYAARTLPATFIIDREGLIRDSWVGRIPRSAMKARIERASD